MEENKVPGENHRPVTSHWHTFSVTVENHRPVTSHWHTLSVTVENHRPVISHWHTLSVLKNDWSTCMSDEIDITQNILHNIYCLNVKDISDKV